jgi:hypothetical protein
MTRPLRDLPERLGVPEGSPAWGRSSVEHGRRPVEANQAVQAEIAWPASPLALYIPSSLTTIGEVALGLARAARTEARAGALGADGVLELAIRAQHDPEFRRFATHFAFARHDEERLAVLWLFRRAELTCSLDELSAALEYVFNFDGMLPANVPVMRFFALLQHFSDASAAAFARALSVAPQVDAAHLFRSVASAFMIRQQHEKLSVSACVAYFNDASLIGGMEAFAVQRFVCIRKQDTAFSDLYADAIVDEADFIRFVLGMYTDSRLQAVDVIRKKGERATLCCRLLRTYLAHQDADEPTLTAELLATVRGRPSFEPVHRFMMPADQGAGVLARLPPPSPSKGGPADKAAATPTALPLAEQQA